MNLFKQTPGHCQLWKSQQPGYIFFPAHHLWEINKFMQTQKEVWVYDETVGWGPWVQVPVQVPKEINNQSRIKKKKKKMKWSEKLLQKNACHKLLYIEWISNNVLLYSTQNHHQYPVINHKRKRTWKRMCVTDSHFAVRQKLAQHCISTIFQ